MSHVLGIDIGTSGCKVTALDKDGTLIVTVSREWFPIRRIDGTSEQDPREWLATIANAVTEVWAVGIDPERTVAIGITGQMQGATFIDQQGEPVRPSILWDDTRSSDQTREILAGRRAQIERTIGCSFSDGLTLGKLLWVREHEPEHWARIATVLHASGYVTHALTGRRLSDVNNIGQSGMNDFAGNSWSEWIVDEFNIPRRMLPEVVQCIEESAHTSDGARLIGLPSGIPVVCAGGDSGAESFSLALAGSPRMKVRLGTAADMNLVLPYHPDCSGIRDVVPGYVLVGAYTKSCASSVRWAREMFYSDQPQTSETFALMDREAGTVPAGSDGLIYHPYLAGEATPYFNSAMSGMLHGMRAGMGRGHVVRAVFEGVAMSVRDAIEHTPGFEDVAEVAFLGGGTKSSLFLSSLADVLGRDGVVPLAADAAYGAALLAGHAVELWDGFELARTNVAAGQIVRFNAENHAALTANYRRYLVEAQRENALMGLPHR